MRIRVVVLLLLVSILLGVVAYVFVYFMVPSGTQGRGYGGGSQRYFWIPILIVPVAFSIGLLGYMALFPSIEQKPSPRVDVQPGESQSLAAVTRVLKEDEKKVVELLIKSRGKMLQRDIARQTGFSRVKTHRILYRLATRGIVTAERYYNTYEIALADWLLAEKQKG